MTRIALVWFAALLLGSAAGCAEGSGTFSSDASQDSVDDRGGDASPSDGGDGGAGDVADAADTTPMPDVDDASSLDVETDRPGDTAPDDASDVSDATDPDTGDQDTADVPGETDTLDGGPDGEGCLAACDPPAPFCHGDELVTSSAECVDDVCEITESRRRCLDAEVCVVDACEPAPGYPTDVPFKGVQPDFHDIDDIVGNGAGHVAMNVVWAVWQPELHTAPCPEGWEEFDGHCFTVDAAVDNQIREYTQRGVSVTGILYGSPAWARAGRSGCPTWAGAATEWFCAPDDFADYARFAGYIAHRYRGEGSRGAPGRVDDFVIWNEVNADDWFSLGGWPNAGDADLRASEHARMFWLASDQIHRYRPEGRVYVSLTHLFEGDAGQHFNGYRVLEAVDQASMGRSWHVAIHPYSRAVGGTQFNYRDDGYITFGTLHELTGWLHALDPADPPTVYITEVGFSSIGPESESTQASAVCRAYRQALATPGVTGFIYHRFQDHPFEVDAGIALGFANPDGTYKPSWSVWALMDRRDGGGFDCGFEHGERVRVYRWRNGAGNYWVTPRDPLSGGYSRETLSWLLHREPVDGTRMLYDCRVPGTEDHFVSTSAGCEGQQPMGPIGWAYTEPGAGRHPMYRCHNPAVGHFVSERMDCEDPAWTMESLLGYGER